MALNKNMSGTGPARSVLFTPKQTPQKTPYVTAQPTSSVHKNFTQATGYSQIAILPGVGDGICSCDFSVCTLIAQSSRAESLRIRENPPFGASGSRRSLAREKPEKRKQLHVARAAFFTS
jgi:hypothetical protein